MKNAVGKLRIDSNAYDSKANNGKRNENQTKNQGHGTIMPSLSILFYILMLNQRGKYKHTNSREKQENPTAIP